MDKKIVFNTKYNRIRLPAQDIEPRKSNIDLTGFIPKERRIKALIEAGERLLINGIFDIPAGEEVDIDNIECDPTRSKSFDLADASMIKRKLFFRKKERDEALKASQASQDGPGSVSRSEPGQLTPKVSEEDPDEVRATAEKKSK